MSFTEHSTGAHGGRNRRRVAIVGDDLMAARDEPLRHEVAHFAQADHAELHYADTVNASSAAAINARRPLETPPLR